MSTIASISTAPGIGGIGIIRMSGENCFEVLEKIFEPKNKQKIEDIKGYTIKYGIIKDTMNNDQAVDEVLVSYFKAPKSYTAENMCEINSHGGNVVVRKILDLCLKNGAELAEPGEFTKRAFLNGRIDLLQAESVIDIIDAKSEKEAKAGINQLEGYLSKEIKKIKQEIMDVMVNLEVSIDYPEYDTPEVTKNHINQMLSSVEKKLQTLEDSFEEGRLVKEGIKTALIGKPNAGKSSLLNAILKENRAIVTEYEGTTRDTIEEFVKIKGIPITFIDTAGIRNAKDEVEKIGIEKSREIAKNADLLIAIFDTSRELSEEDREILDLIKGKTAIIILNKTDLKPVISSNLDEFRNSEATVIKISAMTGDGVEELKEKITELFNLNKIDTDNGVMITNVRHKNLINKAIEAIHEAQKTMKDQMPIDIVAINIKNILENLNIITGEEVSEEIIDEIFSRFCLGK